MAQKNNDAILFDHQRDGIDRRGFLKCMAWAGSGAFCVVNSGVLQSYALGSTDDSKMKSHKRVGLSFVQISDSHMGFNKPANPDVIGTLQAAVDKINALPEQPEFILHTGDISHLSRPSEFDNVDQILKATNKEIFFVPGEHDVLNDDGAMFRKRYGRNSKGQGWYSFDKNGVHFIGLVNVMDLKAGGLGTLGHEQLEWMEDDVHHLKSSTPIIVFAHIPLWSVYPQWGWGTDDSAQALSYLKKFGSVTVLNGHIHQTMQKVEGNVTFHTAFSTAFPQPAPGAAEGPGPMKVPAEQLRSVLGITDVNYVQKHHALGLVDSSLV
ncbi:MAG: metallophosphoesterase family protein [Terriglobales bacterium]